MAGTPAEQEAERRYPHRNSWRHVGAVEGFVAGAEWALEQHRELLEAAREYRDITVSNRFALTETEALAVSRLLAAAAALQEEGAGV